MIEIPTDAHVAFDQFEALTRTIAEGGALIRSHAVIWSQSRDVLLASDYRERLPGFAFQCLSVFKYRDFILHYHPDPQQRRRFLDQLLEPAGRFRQTGERAEAPSEPLGSVLADRPQKRDTREWML